MSRKRLKQRELGFVNYFPANQSIHREYEPLRDPYLEAYFQLPAVRHNLMEGMLKHRQGRHKRSKATTEPAADMVLPPISDKKHSVDHSVVRERIKKLRRRLLSLES